MEVQQERCAGLDVHKDTVVACVRVAKGKRADRHLRTFGTFSKDLCELADWLRSHGVTHVAMEATGVYWKPVWHVLEEDFALILANAAHIKAVPGRKTDVKDAHWIADLLAHGLIAPSFVPPTPIQNLRDLTRTRKQLAREHTQHVQRLQKTLQDANIKVDSVISDLMGVSGRAFLDAIVRGESDPEQLVKLADGRLKTPRTVLVEALRGFATSHHRFLLQLHLQAIDQLEGLMRKVEVEITRVLEPFRAEVERLMSMPGVSDHTAQVLVAEIGVQMERFPTANHLVSWAALCPRNDESAGKKRSTKIRKGGTWLRSTLVQAAWAASRKAGSRFQSLYHRVRSRSGKKKAIIAVAAEMLRCVWHMLSRKQSFVELPHHQDDPLLRERKAKHLLKKLKNLGYTAVLAPAA